jgi:hypothetical protein
MRAKEYKSERETETERRKKSELNDRSRFHFRSDFLYSGTGSNRHCHCWQQDFKSCVSTNSTTRVDRFFSKKNPDFVGTVGAEDRARTGHPDLGKVVLYQMSYFRMYQELFWCANVMLSSKK